MAVDPTYLDPVQAQAQLAVLVPWAQDSVANHPFFIRIPADVTAALNFWLAWSQALIDSPPALLGAINAINTETGAHPPNMGTGL